MAAPSKVARKTRIVGVDPQDFSPSLLRVQNQPPAPFARAMLHALLTPSILEKCKKHNAMLTPLTESDGDLLLQLNGSEERILVQGQFSNPANRIERIVFGDGGERMRWREAANDAEGRMRA